MTLPQHTSRFFLLFTLFSAFAYGSCIEFNAEYIWWQPCLNNLDFAIRLKNSNVNNSGSFSNKGKYRFNRTDFESGVRGGIGVEEIFCGWDLHVTYTYLNPHKANASTPCGNGLVLSTLQHGGFTFETDKASSTYHLRYQTLDGILSYEQCLGPSHKITPFFGVTWLDIHQTRKSKFSNSSNGNNGLIRWEGDYWGVGLRVGSSYTYSFSDAVNCFAKASAVILAGNTDTTSHQTTIIQQDTRTLGFSTNECVCVPGYHLTLGGEFRRTVCGCKVYVRGGYEFLQWHNIPTTRRFPKSGFDLGISTSPTKSTLGLHGIFCGTGFTF